MDKTHTLKEVSSIALIGLPGAGKTSLAQAASNEIGCLRVVSRDLIRDAMFKPCRYSTEEKAIAFDGMRMAQRAIWQRPESTIMDGICFSSREVLDVVASDAEANSVRFVAFFCDCPLDLAINRVESDRNSGYHMAADRNAALVRRVHRDFLEFPPAFPRIDMSKDKGAVLEELLNYLIYRGIII